MTFFNINGHGAQIVWALDALQLLHKATRSLYLVVSPRALTQVYRTIAIRFGCGSLSHRAWSDSTCVVAYGGVDLFGTIYHRKLFLCGALQLAVWWRMIIAINTTLYSMVIISSKNDGGRWGTPAIGGLLRGASSRTRPQDWWFVRQILIGGSVLVIKVESIRVLTIVISFLHSLIRGNQYQLSIMLVFRPRGGVSSLSVISKTLATIR